VLSKLRYFYPTHMFDPDCRLYPLDVDCELVTLVDFPRDLRGDYGGLSWYLGQILYHTFQYCWRVPREAWVLAPDKVG
jgi:hypothetical protein